MSLLRPMVLRSSSRSRLHTQPERKSGFCYLEVFFLSKFVFSWLIPTLLWRGGGLGSVLFPKMGQNFIFDFPFSLYIHFEVVSWRRTHPAPSRVRLLQSGTTFPSVVNKTSICLLHFCSFVLLFGFQILKSLVFPFAAFDASLQVNQRFSLSFPPILFCVFFATKMGMKFLRLLLFLILFY